MLPRREKKSGSGFGTSCLDDQAQKNRYSNCLFMGGIKPNMSDEGNEGF